MDKNIQQISYSKYFKMTNFDCNTYEDYIIYKNMMIRYKHNIKAITNDTQLTENDRASLYKNLFKNFCWIISYSTWHAIGKGR